MKKLFADNTHTKTPPHKPVHIAVIMDGNGRWAKRRGLPRTAGHKKGADTVQRIIKSCIEEEIGYLTLYAFSSENWQRPKDEVRDLMTLLKFYLAKELTSLHKQNIRLCIIGDRGDLDAEIQEKISHAEMLTKDNTALTLSIALSYGSQQEMVAAMKTIAIDVEQGKVSWENVNEDTLSAALYTGGLPDPDLLIRTGGEQRLSNFLLWQCAYTELYFTPVLWPDFSHDDFTAALADFATRERRYGTA
jgi:undecaprenyl diphosphate synthase